MLEDLAVDLLGPKAAAKGDKKGQVYIDEQWRKFWRFVDTLEELRTQSQRAEREKPSSDGSFLQRASLIYEIKKLNKTIDKMLKELDVKYASPEQLLADTVSQGLLLEDIASEVLGTRGVQGIGSGQTARQEERWREFWDLTRDTDPKMATEIIQARIFWQNRLRVQTKAGIWRSFCHILLPGPIVPVDGSRDRTVAVDVRFHQADLDLLKRLGAVKTPQNGSLSEGHFWQFRETCRKFYRNTCKERADRFQTPHSRKLKFQTHTAGNGPLDILKALSAQGRALCTNVLLGLPDTYEPWIMGHDSRKIYPSMKFASPVWKAIRQHGCIDTDDGIRPISAALNPVPDEAVVQALLNHPQKRSIAYMVAQYHSQGETIQIWRKCY